MVEGLEEELFSSESRRNDAEVGDFDAGCSIRESLWYKSDMAIYEVIISYFHSNRLQVQL